MWGLELGQRWSCKLRIADATNVWEAPLSRQARFGLSAVLLIMPRQTEAVHCRYFGTYAPKLEEGQTAI